MNQAEHIEKILEDFKQAKTEKARRKVLAYFIRHCGPGSPFLHAHRVFDEFDVSRWLVDSEYAGKFVLVGANEPGVPKATNIFVEDLVHFTRFAWAALKEAGYEPEAEMLREVKEWKK